MDSLLCEELLTSPSRDYEFGTTYSFFSTNDDHENAFKICLEKEESFMLESGYLKHLQKNALSGARFKAIKWMIKSRKRLNLHFGTIFDAVTYLDRFIYKNCYRKWEHWMIELLSIACLSIAAKSDEVCIPTLMELQAEGLEHLFQASTIQRMEITLLKALSWRLKSATSYSFAELLIGRLDSLQPRLHADLTARVTELLLGTLSDPKFLEFRHSSVAASAFRCALEELTPLKSNTYVSDYANLIPTHQTGEVQECSKCMEERLVDPLYSLTAAGLSPSSPSSPVTVMAMQRIQIFDCYVDFAFFAVSGSSKDRLASLNPKKRKRGN